MWGKRKLARLLKREGIKVSISTVGRILKSLIDRGVVIPVPRLRRKPGGRRGTVRRFVLRPVFVIE
jgi:hypothetical protein